jgi:hypothetical protein
MVDEPDDQLIAFATRLFGRTDLLELLGAGGDPGTSS